MPEAHGLKTRIFTEVVSRDPEDHTLEDLVNAWLVENPSVIVQQILQSQSQPADGLPRVCITILYKV